MELHSLLSSPLFHCDWTREIRERQRRAGGGVVSTRTRIGMQDARPSMCSTWHNGGQWSAVILLSVEYEPPVGLCVASNCWGGYRSQHDGPGVPPDRLRQSSIVIVRVPSLCGPGQGSTHPLGLADALSCRRSSGTRPVATKYVI